MGLLRLFFALDIVVIHSYPIFGYTPIGSGVAVNSFFIISGFYMALILHEKYIGKNGSYRLFIGNRFLRIYPLYWVILLLLFVFSLSKLALLPSHENALTIMFHNASSSPDFLGNTVMAILRNTTLIFTTDYLHQNFHDPGYLLLLPAWSLQVELLFYLFAPFLAKLKVVFLSLLAAPFALVTFSNLIPVLHSDLSITYIFLKSLIFFIMGMVSYTIYKRIKKNKFSKKYSLIIFIIFSVFALVFGYFSTADVYATQIKLYVFPIYYFLLAIAIPFVFNFSKNKAFDAAFGDLSYPVYVSHLLVFKIITNSHIPQQNHSFVALLTVAATLIFSFLLVKAIEKPIDRLRSKRLR